jgi:hypothetical protein
VNMIDRLTTVSNLIPTGFVSELLDGLIMVVKVIGHGGLKSLDGLASMDPTGPYLAALAGSQKTGATYYAITADFDAGAQESTAPLKTLVKDKLMDKIFKNTANDLVVPTEGVFSVADCASFPIDASSRLEIPGSAGVVHTTYFLSPPARQKMKEWLTYESPFAIPSGSPGAVPQAAGR